MKVKLRSLRSLLPSKKIGRKNKKKSPPAEHEAPASNDLLGEDESSSGDTAPTEPPSPDRAKYEASSDDNSADQPPCEAEEVKGGTDDTSDANAREFLPKITEEKVGADDESNEDVVEDLKFLGGTQEKTNRNAFRVNIIEGEAGIELKMDEEEKKNTGKEVDNDAAACRIKALLQNAYGEQFFSGNELESKSQVLLERYAGREALLFAVLEHKSKDRNEAQTDADASEDVVQEPSANSIVSNNTVDVDSDLSTVRIRNDGHATELPTASATAPDEDNGNDIVATELRTVPTEDDDNSIVELNRIGTKDYERLLTPTRPLARGGGGERSELTETSGASTSMFSENSLAGSCTDVDEEDVYDNQTLNTEDEDNGYDAGCYAIEEHPVVARLDKMVGKTTACDPFPAIDRIDDATVDAAGGCSPMGCIDE